MDKLVNRILLEYPIPKALSVWGTESLGLQVEDVIKSVVDDLSADLEVYETVNAAGIQTRLPDTTKVVTAVKLQMPFQGNRYVKFSFDVDTKICMVRYLPAKITYKREFTIEDLKEAKGPQYKYIKAEVLSRLADKELSYLLTVNLESDAGSINLDKLKEFKDKQDQLVEQLHEDIILYSNA